MSKMNFKDALNKLATGTDHKLFVACESFVAAISSWHVHMEDDMALAYVHATVCSLSGSLPFIPDDGKTYHYGEVVVWYLDTEDFYFTTEEEATAYAADCIFEWVKDNEDYSEQE